MCLIPGDSDKMKTVISASHSCFISIRMDKFLLTKTISSNSGEGVEVPAAVLCAGVQLSTGSKSCTIAHSFFIPEKE